jgi:hypothetical protein
MAKKVYLTTKSGKAWRASLVPPKEGERSKVFESENGIAYDLQPSEEKGGGVTPLGPTTASFAAGAPAGMLIAAITGLEDGETITSVAPSDSRLAIAAGGTQLVVGLYAAKAGNISAVLTSSAGRTLNMAITVQDAIHPPYVPTGTLVAGFEATNEWGQTTSKIPTLDSINKVEGVNAVKYSPSAASLAMTINKTIAGLDPASLKAYAVYVKLPTDIAWQSVNTLTMSFLVNAAGTVYPGASKTVLANIWTDGIWLSGNGDSLNATFRNAGIGNHGVRIASTETDAPVGELSVDAFHKDVLANEPSPVVLTFDDGLISQFTIAYPDMLAAGVTGSFTLPTDHLDEARPTCMTWANAEEINASGRFSFSVNARGNDGAIDTPATLLSELDRQVGVYANHGIVPDKTVTWTYGYIREVPKSTSPNQNRFVKTGVALTADSDLLNLSDTSGIAVGQQAVIVGVSTNCTVLEVTPNVSVKLSEPMRLTATGRTVVFVTTSHALYGNKAIDAAIAHGYKMGRAATGMNADAFVGFGFSRRFAMQFPAFPADGQTAASLLALVDSAIAKKSAIVIYFHAIAPSGFPPSEWSIFIAGIKTRQEAGLIKTMSLMDIDRRYYDARPPVAA